MSGMPSSIGKRKVDETDLENKDQWTEEHSLLTSAKKPRVQSSAPLTSVAAEETTDATTQKATVVSIMKETFSIPEIMQIFLSYCKFHDLAKLLNNESFSPLFRHPWVEKTPVERYVSETREQVVERANAKHELSLEEVPANPIKYFVQKALQPSSFRRSGCSEAELNSFRKVLTLPKMQAILESHLETGEVIVKDNPKFEITESDDDIITYSVEEEWVGSVLVIKYWESNRPQHWKDEMQDLALVVDAGRFKTFTASARFTVNYFSQTNYNVCLSAGVFDENMLVRASFVAIRPDFQGLF